MVLKSFIITSAWILDGIFGDPENLPHPVRFIGAFISKAESWARLYFNNKKAGGVFLGIAVPAAVYVCTFCLVKLVEGAGAAAGTAVSILIIYFCLSTRCLADEANSILKRLRDGNTAGARTCLARIVGRDTECLETTDIVRATVESVSENTVDGIIAPLFFAFLGGAPLAMAYKAVNTLDSMVGYKTEPYRELGWFSARLDDFANLIPARLCLVLVPLATVFIDWRYALSALRIGIRDGHKSPSPNSGYPEACFAGALGIQLGGNASYGGSVSQKDILGDKMRERENEDIAKAVRLMWYTSALALLLFIMPGM